MLDPKYFSLTVLLLSISLFSQAESLDAYGIMKKVDERDEGKTRSSEASLILLDKQDRQRVREITLFAFEEADVEKSLIVFRSPSDVAGTSYMAWDWTDEAREDDTWLYLPALKKIRRVAASDESGSFMGSDFSYADINGLEFNDFNYELLKESEEVDGHDCWVVRSTPKNEQTVDETGYTGATSWVRKDAFMVIKGIIDVKKGKRVKYFSVKDIEKIDGIWTAHTLQMVTTRKEEKEHASVLKIRNVVYNKDVDESMFDTAAMQRGL